jgi:hypothetical protein
MALTADRWFTVYELKETSGKSTTLRFEQSAPADDAAARASAAALATDLAAITNAKISKYFTYQEFVEDSFTLPTGAENQNQALLILSIDGAPTKSAKIRVPAAVDGIFAAETGANYDVVDVNDSDLGAFVANFTTEALFYVSDGEQADSLLSGHRRTMGNPRS